MAGGRLDASGAAEAAKALISGLDRPDADTDTFAGGRGVSESDARKIAHRSYGRRKRLDALGVVGDRLDAPTAAEAARDLRARLNRPNIDDYTQEILKALGAVGRRLDAPSAAEAARDLGGGGKTPPYYEIGTAIEAATRDSAFFTKADLIFNPPPKSLAARVSQGLGWLTRGRQAEDRAERLLYFFTAIEALLSSDDKAAPVVQTIARHASVILTDDIASRVGLSAEIKKLYSLRSALVHSGSRSVLWSSANLTQYIAEALFALVLDKGNLRSQHTEFNDELSKASYGLPWRPLATIAVATPSASATAPSTDEPSIARSALARSRARFT